MMLSQRHPKADMGVMSGSWFVIVFNFVDGLASDTEVFIRQLLDCNRKELLRDMGYFGGCGCQPFYELLFLCSGQLTAFY